jgi:hypothetical protein
MTSLINFLPIIELSGPNVHIELESGILNCAKLHSELKIFGIGRIFLNLPRLYYVFLQ